MTRKNDDTSLARTAHFFRACALCVFRTCIRPKSQNEDSQRRELVLNTILFGSMLFSGMLELSLILETLRRMIRHASFAYHGVSPFSFSIVFLLFVTMLYLSRKGSFRLLSWALILLYLLGTSYAAFRWGPDLYQVILSYALIVVIASILFDFRSSTYVSLSIVTIAMSITYLHKRQVIGFDQGWKLHDTSMKDIAKLCVTYLMIGFICWLSNREIQRSLDRAYRSERALKEKNDSLEQIVEERTRELSQAQAEKISQLYRFAEFGKLSSGIFHDLMNPLTVVASNVDQLETSFHPDLKSIKENIRMAAQASRRMEQFMSTVKKHLQDGKAGETFSLNSEIRDTVTLLSHKAMRAGVTLRFRSSRRICTDGSPVQFQQAISNLISNAIDSYEGLKTNTPSKTVFIRLKKKADSACISVTDRGCGISASFTEKVFDPFFTTKSRHKGMGIGLSNTKGIIEKWFSGTIAVQSVEDAGTQFIITIPLKKKTYQ